MDDVLEAIAASPGHFKDILHLAYVERLTGREISVRLGLTLRTVSMRLFRGRRSLRGQLERVFRHRSGAFRRCGRSGGGAPPCAAVET
jgi:DNA-directed RNA polymerase specialized sigma24 family protein